MDTRTMTDDQVRDELAHTQRYLQDLRSGAVPVGGAPGLSETEAKLARLNAEAERRAQDR